MQSWPYFNTPLRVCLVVVGPILLLMGPLAFVAPRGWMRASAGVVLACSAYAVVRGYACRLCIDTEGASFVAPWRKTRMAWGEIRRVERYTPGVGGAAYVYLTSRETPPGGKWDVGPDCIQVQDRPGLLEAILKAQAQHRRADAPAR